jgi:hypothetical protein
MILNIDNHQVATKRTCMKELRRKLANTTIMNNTERLLRHEISAFLNLVNFPNPNNNIVH